MRELHNIIFHDIKFDFGPFITGMSKVQEGLREVTKTMRRNAEAKRAITTSYAPGPFEAIEV